MAFGDKTNPAKPPNSNLSAALRASLTLIENQDKVATIANTEPEPSPLLEATPDSVDELLDRINNHLIEGKVLTDETLMEAVLLYRTQAYRYAQDQENKKPRAPRGSGGQKTRTIAEAVDLEF